MLLLQWSHRLRWLLTLNSSWLGLKRHLRGRGSHSKSHWKAESESYESTHKALVPLIFKGMVIESDPSEMDNPGSTRT